MNQKSYGKFYISIPVSDDDISKFENNSIANCSEKKLDSTNRQRWVLIVYLCHTEWRFGYKLNVVIMISEIDTISLSNQRKFEWKLNIVLRFIYDVKVYA